MRYYVLSTGEYRSLRRKARLADTMKQDIGYIASWVGFGALVGLMYAYFLSWHWGLCALVGLVSAALVALIQVFVLEDVRLNDTRGGEME